MTKENKRNAISKRVRFEVLKRDKFICQYCGAKAPDVLLHVDHMHPASKGGENTMMNLITSCEACNFGKSDKTLDDKTMINKQRTQSEKLQEQREQIEMMMEWQNGLKNLDDQKVDHLCKYWHKLAPGFEINETGKKTIKQLIHRYQIEEIIDAMNISSEKYLIFNEDDTIKDESWENAFDKISGICYIKKQAQNNPKLEHLYKIKNIAKKNCYRFNEAEAHRLIDIAMSWEVPIDDLYSIAQNCRNWNDFKASLSEKIDEYYEDEGAEK